MSLKQDLLKAKICDDLRLAISEAPEAINGKPNPFFGKIKPVLEQVNAKVLDYNENLNLYYKNKDLYIYYGKGGIKVAPTPKGNRKFIQNLGKENGLSIVVIDGVLYSGDVVKITSDGLIDNITITKDPKTLLHGGKIVSPYAVVSIFKDGNLVAKKFENITATEYQAVLKGSYNAPPYPTMMARKSIMKRVANAIYSLLGIVGGSEIEALDKVNDGINQRAIDETYEIIEPSIDGLLDDVKISKISPDRAKSLVAHLNKNIFSDPKTEKQILTIWREDAGYKVNDYDSFAELTETHAKQLYAFFNSNKGKYKNTPNKLEALKADLVGMAISDYANRWEKGKDGEVAEKRVWNSMSKFEKDFKQKLDIKAIEPSHHKAFSNEWTSKVKAKPAIESKKIKLDVKPIEEQQGLDIDDL